jgi:hypothetical protein
VQVHLPRKLFRGQSALRPGRQEGPKRSSHSSKQNVRTYVAPMVTWSSCCETAGFSQVYEMNRLNESLSMNVFRMWGMAFMYSKQ